MIPDCENTDNFKKNYQFQWNIQEYDQCSEIKKGKVSVELGVHPIFDQIVIEIKLDLIGKKFREISWRLQFA